ncbi:hypothetical protein T492DRAFT_618079 [Pavlovales sp. CCMP2436]|nr:hypothetical protein T492DRAFT_618079 [Pavlovales sp. CCMP2436]
MANPVDAGSPPPALPHSYQTRARHAHGALSPQSSLSIRYYPARDRSFGVGCALFGAALLLSSLFAPLLLDRSGWHAAGPQPLPRGGLTSVAEGTCKTLSAEVDAAVVRALALRMPAIAVSGSSDLADSHSQAAAAAAAEAAALHASLRALAARMATAESKLGRREVELGATTARLGATVAKLEEAESKRVATSQLGQAESMAARLGLAQSELHAAVAQLHRTQSQQGEAVSQLGQAQSELVGVTATHGRAIGAAVPMRDLAEAKVEGALAEFGRVGVKLAAAEARLGKLDAAVSKLGEAPLPAGSWRSAPVSAEAPGLRADGVGRPDW